MAARVVVLRVEGVGEADQHVLGLLQLIHERLRPQQVAGAGDELLGVDGLGEEVVATGGDPLDAVLARHQPGDEHDRDQMRALVGLQAAAGLEAGEPRHRDVHEDQVGRGGQRLLDRFGAILGGVEDVAFRTEQVDEDLPVLGQIVDDQDPALPVVGHRARLL